MKKRDVGGDDKITSKDFKAQFMAKK